MIECLVISQTNTEQCLILESRESLNQHIQLLNKHDNSILIIFGMC